MPTNRTLFSTIFFVAPPMFNETDVKVPISDKGDNEHTQIVGGNQFAPRYPTYASAPNYQN